MIPKTIALKNDYTGKLLTRWYFHSADKLGVSVGTWDYEKREHVLVTDGKDNFIIDLKYTLNLKTNDITVDFYNSYVKKTARFYSSVNSPARREKLVTAIEAKLAKLMEAPGFALSMQKAKLQQEIKESREYEKRHKDTLNNQTNHTKDLERQLAALK